MCRSSSHDHAPETHARRADAGMQEARATPARIARQPYFGASPPTYRAARSIHPSSAAAAVAADGRRFLYRLSAKGIDLAPMLVELVIWSARHEQTDAPPAVVRSMRNDRAAFLAEVRQRWRAGS
jgi:hypothetical protein